MTFFNNYKKTPSSQYLHALQIGNTVYGIGKNLLSNRSHGLITKTNLSGQVVWEKSYAPTDKTPIRFEKIATFANGDLFIAGATETPSQKVVITRITPNGDTVWQKYLTGPSNEEYRVLGVHRTDATNDQFYMVLSNQPPNLNDTGSGKTPPKGGTGKTNPKDSGGLKSKSTGKGGIGFGGPVDIGIGPGGPGGGGFGGPGGGDPGGGDSGGGNTAGDRQTQLLLISAQGSIIRQTGLESGGIAGSTSDGEKLVVYGATQHNNSILAACFVFNTNLQLVNQFATEYNTPAKSVFFNATFEGKHLALQGVMRDQAQVDRNFLVAVPIPNQPISASVTGKILPPGSLKQLLINDLDGYLSYAETNASNGEVTNTFFKLDKNLNTVWAKQITLPTELSLRQISDQNAVLHGVNGTLLVLDAQLDSCKTTATSPVATTNVLVSLGQHMSYNILNTQFVVSNTSLVSQSVTSQTEVICASTDPHDGTVSTSGVTVNQSPYFYLQAAGSTGTDSTQGIHLRWMFSDVLGEKHLPKGNYATTNHHFNKPNDVVKVYRTNYQKTSFTLSFVEVPAEIKDAEATWVYRYAGGRELYVYFRDKARYNQQRANNSLDTPQHVSLFIANYSGHLIEVEAKNELFFAVEFTIDEDDDPALLHTETLSVEEHDPLAVKTVSARKTFTYNQAEVPRLVCENGRMVRLKTEGADLEAIHFEFYSDFIAAANQAKSWDSIGAYALTLDDEVAFERLEPAPGLVHGHWKRYNEDAFVNVNNYQHKWQRPTQSGDRNIKEVVNQYIQLSNQSSNPTAIEQVPLAGGGSMEVAHLDLLNFAAYDYHIARMLGLGCLDTLETSGLTTGNGYVYLAEYTTLGDLEDGQGQREVQHLAMTLPTKITDERLPLPIALKEVVPGIFAGNKAEGQKLTDEEGYIPSGESRYVSLYAEELPQDLLETPFYQSNEAFSEADRTYPIYAGLEYKTTANGAWEKPELSHDLAYQNVGANAGSYPETRPILLPAPGQALFVHRQTLSATYYYGTYGINWFSRSTLSNTSQSITTKLKPSNPLKAPTDVQALLIREEKPLLLTSFEEQQRLAAITAGDQTLIRLTFNYHHQQEMVTRQVPIGSSLSNQDLLNGEALYPDSQEIFGDEAEIFYRNKPPQNIRGQVISVEDHPSNPLLSIVKVGDYTIASTGEILSPTITPGNESHYIGSAFVLDKQQHIVQAITLEAGKPVFTLHKNEVQQGIKSNTPATNPGQAQALELIGDGIFIVVENMQNTANWGSTGPLRLKVKIGDSTWGVHREVIGIVEDNGSISRQVEKTRGIWTENATITPEPELVEQLDAQGQVVLDAQGQIVTTTEHRGLYKITFNGLKLAQHPQHNSSLVEWFRGIVRVFTQGSITTGLPNKTRKVLEVAKIDNIDTPQDLVVYVQDATFSTEAGYDAIQTGNNISVNFYPGYKAYLYADSAHQLTEAHILPATDEDVRYSIFSLRSKELNAPQYASTLSVPSLMFAQEIVEAEQPQKPLGALYATRPDFFGRSTYTFTTEYKHRPHGVLFYRASENLLLHALYEASTVQVIKAELEALGGNDETYVSNRWQNFLNFEDLANDPAQDYQAFEGYRFPNPDSKDLFEWANDILEGRGEPLLTEADRGNLKVGDPKLIEFIEDAIYSVFVPLTRLPITYQYIKGTPGYYPNYEPVNKPQVIRDRNGHLLSSTHADFDMAPMMRVLGTSPHQTQFTDFDLDGTTNNLYFYGVRESSTQMKMGEFSPFLGPVKLVNTNPPEAPEVKSIMPRLEDVILDIPPAVELEVNAYPSVQNIKKLHIYRAFSLLEAQSVRTMQLVESIDLKDNALLDQSTWKIEDTFADLAEIPYGEGLFYRITAAREVAYANKGDENDIVVEYAPSKASRTMASMMVEVKSPDTPTLSYTSAPANDQGMLPQVMLRWDKACYKGKYHVYKMNTKGNWVKIYELANAENNAALEVPLQTTNLNNDALPLWNSDHELIYHHFKVVAENTAGMLSAEEKILTVYFQGELPQYALALNGTSDYLESQPGFVQWNKSQPFTMQFFVKDLVNTGGSGFFLNPLFCSLPDGSGGGIHLAYNNQEFMVSMQANSSKFNSRYFSIPLFDFQLPAVTHIALVYNGNGTAEGFSLYLNGLLLLVSQSNNKLGALDIPPTTSFTLGRGYSWTRGTNYAQARLQHFSVVNYAKTEAELLSDLNNGSQATGSGTYLLAYDFNISPQGQSGPIPGLSGSPDLNKSGGSFIKR